MSQPIKGIYEIRNSLTGECYIGASWDVTDRWRDHRSALRHNKHHNSALQTAWNTYGADAFVFAVIYELSDDEGLWEEESLAIQERQPAYNAGKPLKIDRASLDRLYAKLRERRARAQREHAVIKSITVNTAWRVELECECGRQWRIVTADGGQFEVERISTDGEEEM